MKKNIFFILFILVTNFLSAQDDIIFLDNDTIRQEYDRAMNDPHIFKPRHFKMTEEEAIRMADRLPAFAVYRDTYFITGAGVTHTTFLNYTALMIQAAKYYPDFLRRFRLIHNQLLSRWEVALNNSIATMEIKPDINVEIMSILFNSACIKESSERNDDEEMFATNVQLDLERRREVIDYLYNLIKV